MSKKTENLTPWQEKNLEYQKKKATEEDIEKSKSKKFLKFRKKEKENEPVVETEEISENSEQPNLDIEPIQELEENQEEIFEDQKESDESSSDEAEEAYNQFREKTEAYRKENQAEEEEKEPRFVFQFAVLKKMLPVLIIAILVFLGAFYQVSPISKIGGFSVSGNVHEKAEDIAQASNLKRGDSIFHILKNKSIIEKQVVNQFPRLSGVKLKWHFPNKFEAIVTEYKETLYVEQNKKTYLVLENGYIAKNQAENASKLKKIPLLKDFTDAEVKTFVTAYDALENAIKKNIATVVKVPTTATKDFIALNMSDGNQVRLPLSQMADKLPYYTSIAKQVKAPQVIDMEAGIYAKGKGDYEQELKESSESKSKSISESKEKAALSKTNQ